MLLREPVLRKPDELADGAARACPEDIDDDFMSGPVPVLSSSQHDHPIASSDHAPPSHRHPTIHLPSASFRPGTDHSNLPGIMCIIRAYRSTSCAS